MDLLTFLGGIYLRKKHRRGEHCKHEESRQHPLALVFHLGRIFFDKSLCLGSRYLFFFPRASGFFLLAFRQKSPTQTEDTDTSNPHYTTRFSLVTFRRKLSGKSETQTPSLLVGGGGESREIASCKKESESKLEENASCED